MSKIRTALCLTVALTVLPSASWAGNQPLIQAGSAQPTALSGRSNLVSIRFVPPPDQGAPRSGRARGGASRGNCPTSTLPLVTLVPSSSTTNLSTSARPTFWFYIPFPLTSEHSAEFSLLDAAGNYLYNMTLNDSQGNAGVIQVALSEQTPALEVNKTYTWMFQINCGLDNPISTWGEIKRVKLDQAVAAQLQQVSAREQAALYAEHGIWYEAVTTLAKLRLANPTDPAITTDWRSLLESASLGDIAGQVLLPCCIAK